MDLLTGFSTVISVIALGAVLAHVGLVDVHAQRSLAMLSFFVAGPALMLQTISGLEVGVELGANLFAGGVGLSPASWPAEQHGTVRSRHPAD